MVVRYVYMVNVYSFRSESLGSIRPRVVGQIDIYIRDVLEYGQGPT